MPNKSSVLDIRLGMPSFTVAAKPSIFWGIELPIHGNHHISQTAATLIRTMQQEANHCD